MLVFSKYYIFNADQLSLWMLWKFPRNPLKCTEMTLKIFSKRQLVLNTMCIWGCYSFLWYLFTDKSTNLIKILTKVLSINQCGHSLSCPSSVVKENTGNVAEHPRRYAHIGTHVRRWTGWLTRQTRRSRQACRQKESNLISFCNHSGQI